MPGAIDLKDIPEEVRKKMNLRRPAKRSLSMDHVRTQALRVMNVIADFTPAERARILKHALKVNDV